MIYRLIKEKLHSFEIGEYTSYGIELLDEKGTPLDRISDICTKKEKVEKLCRMCNELSLSPIHFRDVVEDFLVEI